MIELRLQSTDRLVEPILYRLADRLLAADVAMPELAAFRVTDAAAPSPAASSETLDVSGEVRIFRGQAPLGGTSRDVDCRWTPPGYELAVTGIGTFRVSGDGRAIRGETRDGAASGGVAETVLGPALILALALQDVWCLHASAIEIGGRAVAFAGDSGAGKSTLAAELPSVAPTESPLRSLADDVLPVAIAPPGPRVLPRFPQLKYPADRQPGAAAPASLPLTALYVLDTSAAGSAEVAVEDLGEADALLALVRHTIASRLFTAALLRRHVDFCAGLVGRVPVRRLRYPRSRDALPRVAAVVGGRLDSSSPASTPTPDTTTQNVIDSNAASTTGDGRQIWT